MSHDLKENICKWLILCCLNFPFSSDAAMTVGYQSLPLHPSAHHGASPPPCFCMICHPPLPLSPNPPPQTSVLLSYCQRSSHNPPPPPPPPPPTNPRTPSPSPPQLISKHVGDASVKTSETFQRWNHDHPHSHLWVRTKENTFKSGNGTENTSEQKKNIKIEHEW